MIIGLQPWFYITIHAIAFVALGYAIHYFLKLYRIIGYKDILWFVGVPVYCVILRTLTIFADLDIIEDLPGKELLVFAFVLFAIGSFRLVVAIDKFIKNGNGKH
jgi:hypothetical protein